MEIAGRLGGRLLERKSFRWAMPILLLGAVVIGAVLRLTEIGHPFASSDHAELAAIISFFYPSDFAALQPGTGRSAWTLLLNPHGIAQSLIATVWMAGIALLNVPITEFWWNVPWALLGLAVVPVGFQLGVQLQDRRAGGLAALILAVLPLHAVLSRASGVSHIPLAFATQLWAVTMLVRYYQAPTPGTARQASLAIAAAVLTDLLLPFLFFMLLGVGVLTVETKRRTFVARLLRARELLFAPRVIRLPLLALTWPVGLMLMSVLGVVDSGGLLGRLFEGSNHTPGLRLFAFWENASFSVGPVSFGIFLVGAIAMLPSLMRLEKRAVPLLWAAVYLGPFVLFSRTNVYGYYLLGLAPLALNAALVGAHLWSSSNATRKSLLAVIILPLLVLLGMRSVSITWDAQLPSWIGNGQAQGGLYADQGLKAAAGWLRDRSSTTSRVFSDPSYEPYQLSYYLRRPFIGMTDARTPEAGYALLRDAEPPQFYLVKAGNAALLKPYLDPSLQPVLTVIRADTPVLYVYGQVAEAPQILTIEQGNAHFDARYGPWHQMFSTESQHR